MMRIWEGETARVRADFVDDTGAPLTALGVSFAARSPTGRAVAGSPVSIGTGSYYTDFVADEPGVWSVRASCTAPTAAATEEQFEVRASFVLSATA